MKTFAILVAAFAVLIVTLLAGVYWLIELLRRRLDGGE